MSLDEGARRRSALSWLTCGTTAAFVLTTAIGMSTVAVLFGAASIAWGWPDWPLELISHELVPVTIAMAFCGLLFADAVRRGDFELGWWRGARRPLRTSALILAPAVGIGFVTFWMSRGAPPPTMGLLPAIGNAAPAFLFVILLLLAVKSVWPRYQSVRVRDPILRGDYAEALRRAEAGGLAHWWVQLVARAQLPAERAGVETEVRGYLAQGDALDPATERFLTVILVNAIVLEKPEEAETLLRGISAGDEDFWVQQALAELLLERGRASEAAAHIDRAVELAAPTWVDWFGGHDPACVVFALRAWGRAEMGEPRERVQEDIETAVAATNPAHGQVNAGVYLDIGRAVQALGEDGSDWLRRGAAADPHGTQGLRCTELLRSLG